MYYDKKDLKDTPSILDGIPFETERRYRKEGARFIMNCGTQMGLGHNTMATGVVYFHRFYMAHSFKSFPRYVTACCCLFLAGKVEETPKKCRDIIKTAKGLLSENHFYSFGDDPKEEVMTLERILLQTIKFDLQVEHPYTFLLKYAKCLKGDQQKLQKMVQMAWNFVNDSLSTVVCLQWEPEIIAVALIHLASKLSKFAVVDWIGRQSHQSKWWEMFVSDVTMDILEDICHQVLDLYQPNNQKEQLEQNSPPQKPISRADSPTLKVPNVTITNSSPVINKARPAATNNITLANAVVTETEINNIQAIKTISTTTNMNISTITNNTDIAIPSTTIPVAASTSAITATKISSFHMGPTQTTVPPPPPPPLNPVLHSLYNNVNPQMLNMPLPIPNYPPQNSAWSHYASSTPSMGTPSQSGNGRNYHVPPPPPPHQQQNYGRRF